MLCCSAALPLSSRGNYKSWAKGCFSALRRHFLGWQLVVSLDLKLVFSKRQSLRCAHGPQLFMLFGFGTWGVSQAFTRIRKSDPGRDCDIFSGKPSSFFLANVGIFPNWRGLFSFPNVLKVNVSIPKEKPLLRDMIKISFILPLSLLPFYLQKPRVI